MTSTLPVIIGASYDFDKRSLDDYFQETTAKSHTYYNNSEWESSKIYRHLLKAGTIEGVEADIDVNKNNFPIYGYVSSFMLELMHIVKIASQVAVVGSHEVEIQVEAYRSFLIERGEKTIADKIVFIHEGNKLSLNSTINKGSKALKLKKGEKFIFSTGDIPFASYADHLNDPESSSFDFVIDLCAKQVIFPDGNELFPRNYYQKFPIEERFVDVKEPNIMQLVYDNKILNVTKAFFQKKRSNGVVGKKKFWIGLGANYLKNYPLTLLRLFNKEFREEIKNGILTVKENLMKNHQYSPETISPLVKKLTGYSMKLKAEHKDPFMLKDIDGWQDLFYYLRIMDSASQESAYGSNAIKMLLPFGEEVVAFDNYLRQINIEQTVPILKHMPKVAQFYAEKLGLGDVYHVDKLVVKTHPKENIQASIDYLIKRTELLMSIYG